MALQKSQLGTSLSGSEAGTRSTRGEEQSLQRHLLHRGRSDAVHSAPIARALPRVVAVLFWRLRAADAAPEQHRPIDMTNTTALPSEQKGEQKEKEVERGEKSSGDLAHHLQYAPQTLGFQPAISARLTSTASTNASSMRANDRPALDCSAASHSLPTIMTTAPSTSECNEVLLRITRERTIIA